LLGDDWVQRHRRIVQQHANQYKRNAWAKVFFQLHNFFFLNGNEWLHNLCISLLLGRFFSAYLFRDLPHQAVGVVMQVVMAELEVVVVLQEHLLKKGM
jgi:hypothetical protein